MQLQNFNYKRVISYSTLKYQMECQLLVYDIELRYMYQTDSIDILKSHQKGSIRLQQKHICQKF